MAQEKPVWEEIKEYAKMVEHLVEKYPDRFDHINPEWIIAYKCTNKTKPESKKKPYEMSGQSEPEAFTNSKKYFVKLFYDIWDNFPEKNQLALVFSALSRISKEEPESGKVLGFDLQDQSIMVHTFGVDWPLRGDIPHLLEDDVEFRDDSTLT